MTKPQAPAETRLQGHWLTLARAVTLVLLGINIFLSVLGINEKWQARHTLRPAEVSGGVFFGWEVAQLQAVLKQLALTPEFVNGVMLAASLVCLACFLGMGGLLFWRTSNTSIGLLMAFALWATGPAFSNLNLPSNYFSGWAQRLIDLFAGVIWPTFMVTLYLFPNGSFVPRFTRWLIVVPCALFGVFFLAPDNPLFQAFGFLIFLGYGAGGVASQIYRYWKVSTQIERQQTKWVVLAFGILISGAIAQITFLGPLMGPVGSSSRFWYEFLTGGVFLVQALIPIAIGVSIIRYHLWDIDLIIRRTLQYSVLSGLLAFTYFGLVIVLQNLLSVFNGQPSEFVTVLSTLAIAALFFPLRNRVQEFIDKRFYRKKYDAQKVLAEFAATCRDETDLDKLTARLAEVIDETLQPEKVSVWIKPIADNGRQTIDGG